MGQDQDLQILSENEIKNNLQDFPGWTFKDDKIFKQFEFASFMDGLKFVNELAPYCNEIDHHPDICINYKKINFTLQRFSVGGKVTERDFKVARKIEDIYSRMYDS